jgi:hypothetical protein
MPDFQKLLVRAMVAAGTAGLLAAAAAPASAQLQYGKWRKTDVCRPASPPVGPGRGKVRMPETPFGGKVRECKWEREVLDCPRLRDKILHPIQCRKRKQTSDYTVFQPDD